MGASLAWTQRAATVRAPRAWGRPLAAALAASAVLHLAATLWSSPSASDTSRKLHGPERTPKFAVQLVPLLPAAAAAPATAARPAPAPIPGPPPVRKPAPPIARARAQRPPPSQPAADPAAPAGQATADAVALPRNDQATGDTAPAQRSMADILKVVPAITKEVAARRPPYEAHARPGSKGTSATAPLEKALAQEAVGEERLANGVVRVVTRWGSYCVKERPGEPGLRGAVVQSCPP